MAYLVGKKQGNKTYYYLTESARVDGKPLLFHNAISVVPKRLQLCLKVDQLEIPSTLVTLALEMLPLPAV
jgi:hypothetical protein